MKRVVITGLGTINSIGHNVEDSFKAVVDGVCGIDTISLFDIEQFPVKIAGEVKNFDPSTVMDKKEVKKADRFIQLGIKAAHEAMMDSGLAGEDGKVACETPGPMPVIQGGDADDKALESSVEIPTICLQISIRSCGTC